MERTPPAGERPHAYLVVCVRDFVLEVGEILLSLIGLSAVTDLSVLHVVQLTMGGWFLGTSYSEVLAAQLGKLSASRYRRARY